MEIDAINVLPELRKEKAANFAGEVISHRSVPVIDFTDFLSRRRDIERELWEAGTTVGFFQIKNHGIPRETVKNAFSYLDRFFNLDETVKSKYPFVNNCGWEYQKQVRPSTGTPDRKESFQITKNIMGNMWPERELPGFIKVMLDLETQSWELGMRVLSCFTRELNVPENFFSIAHDPTSADYQSTLRLLRYFGGSHRDQSKVWGAGAHTDYDCLTLVFQNEGEDGLEVCPGRDYLAGSWTPVASRSGDIITCNIGDMLMRWSDDRLVSNFHRVRMPPQGKKRDSLAFFCQANRDVVIRSKLHGEITAGEFLRTRVTANFGNTAFRG
jgi:isopenicillin N synthase-like dioxygenase